MPSDRRAPTIPRDASAAMSSSDAPRTATLTLRSGARMPVVGLGTWKMPAEETTAAVASALRLGYRHVDCAPVYRNQREVGAAIAAALEDGTLASRDELFVTTKLMPHDLPPDAFESAVRASIAELRCGNHVDLVLLQWPAPHLASIAEQWAAMEALVDAGLARDIGVSNFSAAKLATLMDGGAESDGAFHAFGPCRVKPSVNQVECGAHFRQDELLRRCAERGVVVQAYGPLGSGDQFESQDGAVRRKRSGPPPLANPNLVDVAARAGVSPAYALLKWNVSRGVAVLPKSADPNRQAANLAAGDADAPALPEAVANVVGGFGEQYRLQHGSFHTGPGKPYETLRDLWDEDVGYMEGRDFERPEGFRLS